MAATVGGGGARGPHVFVVRPPPPSRYRRQTLIKYNRMVSAPASSTPSRCPSTRQEMSKARNNLAARLQENWLRKHPDDKASHEVDDSLTSLGWLQNLSIMKLSTPTPPASPNNQATVAGAHVSPNAAMSGSRPLSPNFLNQSLCDPPGVNPNSILNMSHLTTSQSVPNTPSLMKQECRSIPSPPHRGVGDGFEGCDFPPGGVGEESEGELPDYCINPCIKPPFSYATLICMAMRDSRRQKITLAGIYKWITDNFIYYRVADPSWQNSIRHNLSLNKCFQKVARRKDEPGGKGGFWKINPQYSDTLVNGILTRRRGSGAGGTSSASTKDTLNAFGYLANTTTNSNSNPLLNGLVNLDGPPLKKIKREALDLDGLTESDFMNDAFNDVHDDDDDDDDEDMDDGDTCSTTGYSTDVAPSGYVSRAETSNAVFHLTTGDGHDDDDIINNTLSTSDFSWSALMNRDIDIGGVNVKTEDLIDHELSAIDAPPPHLTVNDLSTQADDNVSNHVTGRVTKKSDTPGDATPITDMSPPPSEDNSDLGVDDLLFNMSPGDVNSSDLDGVSGTPALDFLSGDPLDLTISGTGLNKPSWWVEGVNELLKSPTRTGDGGGSSSRINTPVMQSPDHHPWAECKSYLDDAISSFDVDFKDFFDLEDKADTGSAS